MKTPFPSFCLVGLLIASVLSTPLRAETFLSEKESLGPLALNQKQDAVLKLLGPPKSKGKDIEWEAIGEFVQEWKFPKHGLVLNMASVKEGGPKKILSITASKGCTFATKRGIQIGSPAAAVKKAYGSVEDKESSEPGQTFVAGSIYGGVIFHFKAGQVSEIFLGAAAE